MELCELHFKQQNDKKPEMGQVQMLVENIIIKWCMAL